MIDRETIKDAIEKVPDEFLEDLYNWIKQFESKMKEKESELFVLERLRRIRISASPDFSTKADLYTIEDENVQ